jgi:hypothetical protein
MLSAFIKNINRHQWVSDAAYYRAMARGFNPRHELDDWLAAELDYLTMLIDLQLHVLEEDGSITKMGLRQIAESLGVEHPELMHSELMLIRAIQEASHHYPCFRSASSESCKEMADCQWMEKCRKIVAIWHR